MADLDTGVETNLTACVCAAVTSVMRLPSYTGAPVVFTYPFLLR